MFFPGFVWTVCKDCGVEIGPGFNIVHPCWPAAERLLKELSDVEFEWERFS